MFRVKSVNKTNFCQKNNSKKHEFSCWHYALSCDEVSTQPNACTESNSYSVCVGLFARSPLGPRSAKCCPSRHLRRELISPLNSEADPSTPRLVMACGSEQGKEAGGCGEPGRYAGERAASAAAVWSRGTVLHARLVERRSGLEPHPLALSRPTSIYQRFVF